MANYTITPNMNLTVPTATIEIGPAFAVEINGDLSILDSHNHTVGNGVQIPSAGLNINADLSFNSANAISLRSTRFVAQSSPLSLGSDIGAVYVSGVDLYYNDINGNQIRITQSGGISGSPGSISGLASPASASYNSGTGTFIWQSAALTAANMDFGSAVLRNGTASSFGLTLSPPSLASNYTITLPALPGASSFMQIDASGNISNSIAVANGIMRNNLAAVGQQVSANSNGWSSTGSLSYEFVGSLSVTITTTGRPVNLGLFSGVLGGIASINVTGSSAANLANFRLSLNRSGTTIGEQRFEIGCTPGVTAGNNNVQKFMPSIYKHLDVVGAGTYTYQVQVVSDDRCFTTFSSCNIYAYEL